MSEVFVAPAEAQTHVCYNTGKDKRQQKALRAEFGARAKQSEPENLAIMQYFKKNTPMFGKTAEGGPILGWHDFHIVCTAGATVFRFYLKNELETEVNVTWITPELRARLNEEAERLKAARAAGTIGPDPVFLGIPAVSNKFKY